MYTLTIKKDSVITHGPSSFETEEELQNHFNSHKEMGSYGLEDEYTVEIEDITEQVQAQADLNEKVIKGQIARETCQKVLDLVAGYNLDRELTIQQITQMQTTFANSEAALRAGRPTFAKAFISAIQADGVLVTQDMKDLCLQLLEGY